VPASVEDDGHLAPDSIAEITWGPLANANGGATWTRSNSTCASTYCHGDFPGGNASNLPTWTGIDQATCGTCHDDGTTPSNLLWKHDTHVRVAGLKCAECHAQVIDTTGLLIDPVLHVNGVVDTLTRDSAVCNVCHSGGTQSCVGCHGGIDNQTGAPPKGLRGEMHASTRAVGAHSKHLSGGIFAAALACSGCHTVPATMLDPGHLGTDSVAELTWHGISNQTGGASWNRTSNSCAATYCHGNFPGGKAGNIPVWTSVNQATCGSCHDAGTQPAELLWKHEFHVSVAGLKCADCHAQVVDLSNNITDLDLHVNGAIDTLTRDTVLCNSCHGSGTQSCTVCHGGTDNQTGAPPKGLHGEILSSTQAVGAHSRHLSGGQVANGRSCSNCHIVPSSVLETSHLGADSIAEITWSGISNKSGGANWSRVSNKCGSVYCHGNFVGGKAGNAPTWNSTSQATCGSCHDAGTQPSLLLWKHDTHVTLAGLICADCHGNVVNGALTIIDRDLHVNGNVDTLTQTPAKCAKCHSGGADRCIRCHGGTNSLAGDPPNGLRGETAISTLAVGAHDKHLRGGSISDGGACLDCHVVPAQITTAGHLAADSVAEIIWGNYANKNGGAAWNRTTRTCASTYCHGNFSGGKSTNAPTWTGTNQAACGSCHDTGASPSLLRGRHSLHVGEGIGCYQCHSATVNSSKAIIGLSLHINNVNNVSFWNGTGSYTASSRQCSNPGGCHGGETW
jgi:predicted CxxxxCH...CXXCH cytochrome family protein